MKIIQNSPYLLVRNKYLLILNIEKKINRIRKIIKNKEINHLNYSLFIN